MAWLGRQTGMVLPENVLPNAGARESIALTDPGMAVTAEIRTGRRGVISDPLAPW